MTSVPTREEVMASWRGYITEAPNATEGYALQYITDELSDYLNVAPEIIFELRDMEFPSLWGREVNSQEDLTRIYLEDDSFIVKNAFSSLQYAHSPQHLSCIDYFKTNKIRQVLDYGCGSGSLALVLAKLGFTHISVADVAPKSIDFAAWRFQYRNLSCTPTVYDTEKFNGQTFNGIFVFDVYDIIFDHSALTQNLYSLCADGGLVAINLRKYDQDRPPWLVGPDPDQVYQGFIDSDFHPLKTIPVDNVQYVIWSKGKPRGLKKLFSKLRT